VSFRRTNYISYIGLQEIIIDKTKSESINTIKTPNPYEAIQKMYADNVVDGYLVSKMPPVRAFFQL
jgi:hypothetical protein